MTHRHQWQIFACSTNTHQTSTFVGINKATYHQLIANQLLNDYQAWQDITVSFSQSTKGLFLCVLKSSESEREVLISSVKLGTITQNRVVTHGHIPDQSGSSKGPVLNHSRSKRTRLLETGTSLELCRLQQISLNPFEIWGIISVIIML